MNLTLSLFIASELSFYLLIAQTGIVEVFSSNMLILFPLPLGGVLGSLVIGYIQVKTNYKIFLLLSLQTIIVSFYPNLSFFGLLSLGFCVGAMAPLVIELFKQAKKYDYIMALGLSYSFGTLLFTTNPMDRMMIGVALSGITLVASLFLFFQKREREYMKRQYYSFSLFTMSFWVFLDASLFEILSRDLHISIWRDGYGFEIALFHIVGILVCIFFPFESSKKTNLFILITFLCAYLLYFAKQPLLLAAIYPFIISYYNTVVIQTLTAHYDLKQLGHAMVFVGWIASGCGLLVALLHGGNVVALLLGIVIIFVFKHYVQVKSRMNINI